MELWLHTCLSRMVADNDDDDDDDDDDVDNDYSDFAVSADDEYDGEVALRCFPQENPRHP